MFRTILQDVRYAARSLRRVPGYAAVAIIVLALGIGANTAIFSLVHGVLLRALPFDNAERVVVIRQPARGLGIDDAQFSVPELRDYAEQNRTLDALVEYHSMTFNMIGRGEPRRVRTGVVSAAFFTSLGVRPLIGRVFAPAEDAPGSEPVIVVSHRYWRDQLGGDPAIVGSTVQMTDRVHTIVGVLPPLPSFPGENDVYMPTSSCPFRSSPAMIGTREMRMMVALGVVARGIGLDEVRRDLGTISARLGQTFAGSYPAAQRFDIEASPLRETLSRAARPALLVLGATALFVLLIACANVANLTLVRLLQRRQEMAVRASLGATPERLFRQLLVESGLLVLAGTGLGVVFAYASLGGLAAFAARYTPRAVEVQLDLPVLAFTIALAAIATLAVGSLPFLATRRSLHAGLRGGASRSTRSRTHGRVERVLVASQVAACVVLLSGAGLTLRSLARLASVDGGFDSRNVATARVTGSRDRYTSGARVLAFNEALLARVRAIPGVERAAIAGSFPLNAESPMTMPFRIDGRAVGADSASVRADYEVVSDGYFATIGSPLLEGRDFTSGDRREAPAVVLVNRSLAHRHWPRGGAVGQRVSFDGQRWLTIVGVVADVKQQSLASDARDVIYRPATQNPVLSARVLARSTLTPGSLTRRIIAEAHALDPEAPVDDVRTLDQIRDDALATWRLMASLLSLFAGLAVVIAATGIGGVLAFAVGRRTRELGLRLALGAEATTLRRMVLFEGVSLTAGGVVVGLAAAAALTRFIATLLYGVGPTDPATAVLVCVVLGAVTVIASLGPARRATSVDPMIALRSE
jgi:putative ABC transport system permease protein